MKNKNIVIYGASSGIGENLVKLFSRFKTNKVFAHYRTFLPSSSCKNIIPFSNYDFRNMNKLDIVVMLQGRVHGKNISQYNNSIFDESIRSNLGIQVEILNKLLTEDKLKKGCQTIFCSSVAGQRGSYDPIYAAAKAGIIAVMKSLVEQEPNYRWNCVCPSTISNTKMTQDDLDQDWLERKLAETKTGRLNKSEDIANIIYDICQPHWHNLNGACIDINGGSYVR